MKWTGQLVVIKAHLSPSETENKSTHLSNLLDIGAALAANNLAGRDEFAAKAAPTFTVIRIGTSIRLC
jgi:hypothetical protein